MADERVPSARARLGEEAVYKADERVPSARARLGEEAV